MTWCRDDLDADHLRRVGENELCPSGYTPTFFGPSACSPEGCKLGSYEGFCIEFWIALGVIAVLLFTEKK